MGLVPIRMHAMPAFVRVRVASVLHPRRDPARLPCFLFSARPCTACVPALLPPRRTPWGSAPRPTAEAGAPSPCRAPLIDSAPPAGNVMKRSRSRACIKPARQWSAAGCERFQIIIAWRPPEKLGASPRRAAIIIYHAGFPASRRHIAPSKDRRRPTDSKHECQFPNT